MQTFNYDAPAEVYFSQHPKQTRYRPFSRASAAIQFVAEELKPEQLRSCVMEVGELRFRSMEIRDLYLAASFPLPRVAAAVAA